MRIGITGATGFIGQELTKAAIERGHDIVAFSRGKSEVPGAREVRPLFTEGPLALEASGLDALVHLAGENILGYWTEKKKQRIYDSRVIMTRRIIDSLRAVSAPPSVFVCGSGTGAYGDRGDEILTEESARGQDFLAKVCQDWESAACLAHTVGSRVVLLRTGMVLGASGGAWPFLKRVFSFYLGSRLGSGKQWIPWIHVQDEVGIILHSIENRQVEGPVNLASPHPVTNAQLTKEIASLLGRPVMPPVPAFMLKLLLRDLSAVMLGGQRVQPKAALDSGYQFKYAELPHALATLV